MDAVPTRWNQLFFPVSDEKKPKKQVDQKRLQEGLTALPLHIQLLLCLSGALALRDTLMKRGQPAKALSKALFW